jgi:hypothetical protein
MWSEGFPGGSSPIAVGVFHREAVGQMADFMHFTVLQEYLDDVETQFYARVAQQPEVIQGGSSQALPPFLIHGGCGPIPLFRGARLYLGENEAVAVPQDQIDFAAWRPKICGEKFQALAPELFARRSLAEFAVTEMEGLGFGRPPGFDACREIHAAESFECKSSSFYNYPVPKTIIFAAV